MKTQAKRQSKQQLWYLIRAQIQTLAWGKWPFQFVCMRKVAVVVAAESEMSLCLDKCLWNKCAVGTLGENISSLKYRIFVLKYPPNRQRKRSRTNQDKRLVLCFHPQICKTQPKRVRHVESKVGFIKNRKRLLRFSNSRVWDSRVSFSQLSSHIRLSFFQTANGFFEDFFARFTVEKIHIPFGIPNTKLTPLNQMRW